MRFSERKGYKAVRNTLQVDGLGVETRNQLWNLLHVFLWSSTDFTSPYVQKNFDNFSFALWHGFYKRPVDKMPDVWGFISQIRKDFFESGIAEFYDFLEYTLTWFDNEDLNTAINFVLEAELVGFRFVGTQITDIADEQEVLLLETSLAENDYPLVREHLQRSLSLLSDRQNPDYRNSIKESISAVESLAKQITGKPNATLAEAIKALDSEGKLHSALRDGWVKLYGYTSNAKGIRHALLEEDNLTANDAKYFLLTCTSFINYLKSKI